MVKENSVEFLHTEHYGTWNLWWHSVSVFCLIQILVVPEGAEAVSRPSPDYPMLPTIPLSAFSDPKKTKTSHVSKVGWIACKKRHFRCHTNTIRLLVYLEYLTSKCHNFIDVIWIFALHQQKKRKNQKGSLKGGWWKSSNHFQLFSVCRIIQ